METNDLNFYKKPNSEDYGLNDVDYFQDCKDYDEWKSNHQNQQ